jgi:hypothetical protein
VGVSASVNSEVKIIPRDSASESDGEDGVTKVAAVVLAADTSIQVRSTVPLKKGLVLWIEREALLVQTVDAGSVVVTRGYLWTTAADHPIGAPIKAYVSPIETSKYYEVGDSGILFGVELDSGASAKARTVKVGDGITIETKGLVLKAFEGGITRAADNASINLYGRKDLQIGRNRLLDLVKTDIVAEQTLAEFSEPRVGAQDITSALYYWFEIGDPVEMNDATLIPGGGTVSFEIVSLFFDPAGFRLQIGVRSYDAVEGSGKSSGVVKRGRGAPRGRRGDR